jgi:hypothetical protein
MDSDGFRIVDYAQVLECGTKTILTLWRSESYMIRCKHM